MQNVKKDNLTDLVDQITKPQEASPAQSNEGSSPQPQPKPQGGLNDYQVTTPDGEVVDLALQAANKDGNIKQVLSGVDKKGNQYILVVQRKTS